MHSLCPICPGLAAFLLTTWRTAPTHTGHRDDPGIPRNTLEYPGMAGAPCHQWILQDINVQSDSRRPSETLRDPQRLSETRVQTWVSIYSWSMLIIHLDPSLVTGGTLTHPRWNLLKKLEPWSVLKCHLGLCISGFLADLFLLIQLLATNVACWTRSDCVADSVLTLCWLGGHKRRSGMPGIGWNLSPFVSY